MRPAVRLALAPDHGVAVCVMASGDVQGMGDKLESELLQQLVGMSLPTSPAPVDRDVDVADYIGRFWISDEATVDVRAEASGLVASFTTRGRWAEFHGDFTTPMTYAGGTTFLMTMPPVADPVAVTFLREDGIDGPTTHFTSQLRAAPRAEASTARLAQRTESAMTKAVPSDNSATTQRSRKRAIGMLPLVGTFFCTVSSGPSGVETAISGAGPGMALLLLVLVSLVFGVPHALMVAELSSADTVGVAVPEARQRAVRKD